MRKALIFLAFVSIAIIIQAQSSKSFKWVAWKNVTPKTKAELKKIQNSKEVSAYDYIIETLEDCDIEVAVLDMDGDGIMEYAVGSEGRICCGSRGCGVTIYRNGGKQQVLLSDFWHNIKPAKNGVISSTGVLIKFETQKM